MAKYYFFTEPAKLQVQTSGEAFGAIDENNYRLGNMFSANPLQEPKAFAVTSGNVLVQAINGNTSLVNIVLKPEEQPNLNFPKIDYIIYKGVAKTSIIDSNNVAVRTKNDLTKTIWESHDMLVAAGTLDIDPIPLAASALGFGYSATAMDEYKALDEDSLNVAFYNNENRLSRVESGDYLGDFSAALGVLIVFEKIGFEPTFKLARELDSKISFTAISPTATNTDKFKRKHDKEDVLSFMDSAAFFSAFDGAEIKVTTDGTTFEEKSPEEFYTEVTVKHHNKNSLYLDIRNENLDSFNYYENYSNLFNIDLIGDDTYVEEDYYRNKWPLIKILDSEFDALNTEKTIGFSLNKGDNEFPRFFLKKGNLLGVTEDELQNPSTRFLDVEANIEDTHYGTTHKLQIPKTNAGIIKANYFQLSYIKRYATPDSSYKGLSLKNESFLDNLFPIFDMKLPFVEEKSVNSKMFTDACYVDKTNINEIEFTTNLGITTDSQNISFIALPNQYNATDINTKDKAPIYTEQSNEGTFVSHFNNKTIIDKIQNDLFQTKDEDFEFLSFPSSLNEIVLEDPESASISNDIALDDTALKIDTENINILALTRDQFTQLEIVKSTEFTAPYKVYLGIANTQSLTSDEDLTSTTFYALRGIKENDSGELESHEYVTDLQVFAEDDLYNYDSDTETGKVVEAYWVDENGNGITNLPFEEDEIRVYVKTEEAIGKKITVRVYYDRTGIDTLHKEFSFNIETNTETYKFSCNPEFFKKDFDNNNIKEFYLYIKIGEGKFRYYSQNQGDRLRIHAVRFIPDLMQHKGWLKGLEAQNLWFNSAEESTPDVNVEIEFVTMAWVRSFPRTEDDYQNIITTIWNDSSNYASLRSEVNKMITYSNISGNPTIAELPTIEGENKPFGDFSLNIVFDSSTGKTLPLIEHFYYKNIAYDFGFGIDDPLDDLYATLANFNFRIAAKGYLSLESGIIYINITKIGVYIRDSFDFTNPGWSDQDLGAWNFIDKTVSKIAGAHDYSIENSDYNNWRNDHNKGGDFRLYSDVIEINKTLKITLN